MEAAGYGPGWVSLSGDTFFLLRMGGFCWSYLGELECNGKRRLNANTAAHSPPLEPRLRNHELPRSRLSFLPTSPHIFWLSSFNQVLMINNP